MKKRNGKKRKCPDRCVGYRTISTSAISGVAEALCVCRLRRPSVFLRLPPWCILLPFSSSISPLSLPSTFYIILIFLLLCLPPFSLSSSARQPSSLLSIPILPRFLIPSISLPASSSLVCLDISDVTPAPPHYPDREIFFLLVLLSLRCSRPQCGGGCLAPVRLFPPALPFSFSRSLSLRSSCKTSPFIHLQPLLRMTNRPASPSPSSLPDPPMPIMRST